MASPANPVITPPAATPAPNPNPPAIQQTEHTHLDSVANRIAASLAAARQPEHPNPGLPATPNQPIVPPLATTPAAPAPVETPPAATPAPVSEPPTTDLPSDIDLSTIDFDSPPPADEPITPELPSDNVKTAATTPESEVLRELAETLAKGDVPAKVEEVFLKTPRGRQMLTSFKTLRDLAQPPEKGGIGRVPTTEEIRESDASHRTLEQMRFDIQSNPLAFAQNLFNVDPNTGSGFLGDPANTARILESIPEALFTALDQTQSPVYQNLIASYSIPVFKRFFDHQYLQAFSMPEENSAQIAQYKAANQTAPMLDDKIRMLDALQISEFKAFGKARPINWTPGSITTPSNGHSAAPDPEKQQYLERLRAADAQIAQYRQQQVSSVTTAVESTAKSAALSDIDTALRTVGVHKIYPQSVIRSQQNDIYEELKSSLPTNDPSGWQRYQIQLQQASRGQATPESVSKLFRQLFQNALRHSPQVKERLNDLVKGAKVQADARHTIRAESQLRTEPNGAGIPAPSSVVPSQQLARQPGETLEDFNTRRILAASQRAQQQPAR